MRNLRQPIFRKFISLEKDYLVSKERVNNLKNAIDIGEKAENILMFAESYLDDVESEVLDGLRSIGADLPSIQSDYRAALRFYEKVLTAINEGKRKEETLKMLSKKGE